ncbi:MAG: hypothetical protein ACTSR2_00860 [Candidatus Hodarchaeales archaeon]
MNKKLKKQIDKYFDTHAIEDALNKDTDLFDLSCDILDGMYAEERENGGLENLLTEKQEEEVREYIEEKLKKLLKRKI